ncbi:MAG: LysE family transporter [Rhodobacterales bacterium]|jgi:L-lysine exporter family protein LysE/ArgO|nr:LysE family transporter [Rhodobacterales bacterium]MDA7740111.1 LysE family transporter [Amylibacter sp.]MBT6895604.1 LysE family transporter [Rhodobacterales bacterium]MBT7558936.1 LysE family transporter [Rhodobacterales bacterium]MDA8645099.1 LysE family transporter [Amylibacter sp.]|tara:strand:- start:10487 stop:11095 length:609 start_codon:yes stop_codon:yes gene_type:complete
MLTVGLTGFFTSLSLILAIGAQNTMLLRQGLTKQHIFWACIFCSVSDAILILFGIFGFDFAASKIPNLAFVLTIGGIIFLISYGSKRLWAAYIGSYEIEINGKSKSLSSVLASLAAVTWLNPHVYLDTMVLLGAISVQYNNLSEKIIFAIFAMIASFVFFFSLGYGAKFLAPYFKSIKVWVFLDITIAFIMYAIAYGLYKSL